MIDLKQLQENDPLKRLVEKEHGGEELSPMDPPDAFSPPNLEPVDFENLHPFLKTLVDEHGPVKEELDGFSQVLDEIRDKGPNRDLSKGLSHFFAFLDSEILAHNRREDFLLFPELKQRMVANGEHSNGPDQQTGVDMLEDDHVRLLQMAAVSFNLIALSARLPDHNSRVMILDAGLAQGKELVDMLRLHIFREENVIFPLAQKYFTQEELDAKLVALDNWK